MSSSRQGAVFDFPQQVGLERKIAMLGSVFQDAVFDSRQHWSISGPSRDCWAGSCSSR